MNRSGRVLLWLAVLPACSGSDRAEVRPPPMGTLPEPMAAAPPASLVPPLVPEAAEVREALGNGAYPVERLPAIVADVHPESVHEGVLEVYARSKGAWLWSDGPALSGAAGKLLQVLDAAEDVGLRASVIRSGRLRNLERALGWNQSLLELTGQGEARFLPLVRLRGLLLGELDAQLTAAALSVARALDRTDASGRALAGALPAKGQLGAWVDGLLPRHPQYVRLTKAMARYRGYVARGAFTKLALPQGVPSIGKGGRGPLVTTLRTRLGEEGFASGPEGEDAETFDATLQEDLRAFQYSRGLAASGLLDAATAQALNVQPWELVARIERALGEWRQSPARDLTTFVEVNLPEFAVEVYRDGRRVGRHRAVIGYPFGTGGGRTKRYHAEVTEVVLNPGWTPSDGILEGELMPKEGEAPGFLEKKGFYWFTRPDGRRGVYQLPGRKNVLGRAVIRFPNENNIYLHGSPDLKQFDGAVRAMSHGCVRVERIEDLAADLLLADGSVDRSGFDQAMASGRTTTLVLKKPVPIHFEYVLVVVDDDDTVRFLPNVYRI